MPGDLIKHNRNERMNNNGISSDNQLFLHISSPVLVSEFALRTGGGAVSWDCDLLLFFSNNVPYFRRCKDSSFKWSWWQNLTLAIKGRGGGGAAGSQSPASRPLLWFFRYHVNHAVCLPIQILIGSALPLSKIKNKCVMLSHSCPMM